MSTDTEPVAVSSYALLRAPTISVFRVIEVRFLRGAGVPGDPVREVVSLYRDDGEHIVELDEWAADS